MSSGGKSALLGELERRGYAIVEEPDLRVIAQERLRRGSAFPWTDITAFAIRALDMAHSDRDWAMGASGFVFFDRGLVDAAAALEHATHQPLVEALAARP